MKKRPMTFMDYMVTEIAEEANEYGLGRQVGIREALEMMRATFRLYQGTTIRETIPVDGGKYPLLKCEFPPIIRSEYSTTPDQWLSQAIHFESMAPLFRNSPTNRCVQVSNELAGSFVGASVGKHNDRVREYMTKYCWYIDFMHADIAMPNNHPGCQGNEDYNYLRAIFINPLCGLPCELYRTFNEPVILAVFDNGKNNWGDSYCYWYYRRDYSADAFAPFSLDGEILPCVEDIIDLTILYSFLAHPDNQQPIPRVPKKTRLDAMRPLNQRRALTDGSLFHIVKLTPPADNFGRTVATPGRMGWKLDHRVRVRDHYKIVHCGVGRTEEKLVYIKPYIRGPKDAPMKSTQPLYQPTPVKERENA